MNSLICILVCSCIIVEVSGYSTKKSKNSEKACLTIPMSETQLTKMQQLIEYLNLDGSNSKDINKKEASSLKFYTPTDYKYRPTDCSEILVSGITKSGVYDIYPYKCHCTSAVKVYCDMEHDGGGWTVFLSRTNSSKPINFTRNWQDYKDGFGDPEKEHWLGNENLHKMTFNRLYIMRMEAEDNEGRQIWGEWNLFKVDKETNKFKISISSYNGRGTAYDRFSYFSNQFFSTFDNDNDKNTKNCAQTHKGGWWFNSCAYHNPTGIKGKNDETGMRFQPWSRMDNKIRYAKHLQLKIRPLICSETISTVQFNTHNCAQLH